MTCSSFFLGKTKTMPFRKNILNSSFSWIVLLTNLSFCFCFPNLHQPFFFAQEMHLSFFSFSIFFYQFLDIGFSG